MENHRRLSASFFHALSYQGKPMGKLTSAEKVMFIPYNLKNLDLRGDNYEINRIWRNYYEKVQE